MRRRWSSWMLVAVVLAIPSCQRAQRFPPAVKSDGKAAIQDDEDHSLYRLSWIETDSRRDVPIVFVPDTSEEWGTLKESWNAPPFPAGMPTIHLGLNPLQALAALVVADHHAVVKIKVPRGLPDPTPNIPTANPPTLGKWRLGKALFSERLLDAEGGPFSCAECHKPHVQFTESVKKPRGGVYNTLSLINVVYNRRQFWDGRVETLEETIVRSREDEHATDPKRSVKALHDHNWGGFTRSLVAVKRYNQEFKLVYGIDQPTQDTVAKALATYMRTILSGDSLYDRAEQQRKNKKADVLTAAHFLEALTEDKAVALVKEEPVKKYSPEQREETAAMLERGFKLYRAHCAQCHPAPLFTDHDYHNVGYMGKEGIPNPGVETGRSAWVPVGHKEWRLQGAFRTPTLRNLANAGPYMHNGEMYELKEVVDFFDHGVLPTTHLAAALRDGDEPRKLNLQVIDKDALVMFLRALEGTPLDPIVSKVD